MSNICLIVLIGIPGVGKTQLSNYIIKNFTSPICTIQYVSYDEYVKCSAHNLYKMFRANVYGKVEIMIENLIKLSENKKYLIIIDDNMYYRSMRRTYYQLAKRFHISFCQIFVTCCIEVAILRNNSRNSIIPTCIIHEMAKKLEPPFESNKWEEYSLTINSTHTFNSDDLINIRNIIDISLKNPALQIELNFAYNHISFIHNVDLMLRKIINMLLKEILVQNDNNTVKILSKKLVNTKKLILNDIRSKKMFLPEYQNDAQLFEILFDLVKNICS